MSHQETPTTGFHPTATGASILGLLLLAATGWVVRKQITHLSAPLLKQVSEVPQKPWVKTMVSWLQSCPYTVAVQKRVPATAIQ